MTDYSYQHFPEVKIVPKMLSNIADFYCYAWKIILCKYFLWHENKHIQIFSGLGVFVVVWLVFLQDMYFFQGAWLHMIKVILDSCDFLFQS